MPVREPARGRGTDPAPDNHLYIAQFGVAEGVKHIFLRRINCLAGLPFSRNGTEGIYKIGLLLLFSQHVMPLKVLSSRSPANLILCLAYLLNPNEQNYPRKTGLSDSIYVENRAG